MTDLLTMLDIGSFLIFVIILLAFYHMFYDHDPEVFEEEIVVDRNYLRKIM